MTPPIVNETYDDAPPPRRGLLRRRPARLQDPVDRESSAGRGEPIRRTPAASRAVARLGRALRGLSGAVTAGLVVLAGVVVVASVLAGDRPGPGAGAITGHVAVAITAVVLQIAAERRRGVPGALAALATLPLAAATLWVWWWS